MDSSLTLNIKFEFLLAYTPSNLQTPYPFAKGNTQFHNKGDDSQDAFKHPPPTAYDAKQEHSLSQTKTLQEAAIQDLTRTLEASKFPIDQQDLGGHSNTPETRAFWSVRPNETVQSPPSSNYSFIGLEISTPTYISCQDAINQISIFCPLMTKTYSIHTNSSCGMHVNVGNGQGGFRFVQLRTFAALFWAYEPQIECLTRPLRTHITWEPSMRDNSNLQINYQLSHEGERVPPAVGIAQIMNTKNLSQLMNLIGHQDTKKHGDINFSHTSTTKGEKWKEIIEFRGRVATFITEEVVNCIEMWVGVVGYVRDISPGNLYHLLMLAGNFDTWEKRGDGKDSEREKANGSILAESKFTIIHLLRYFKLYKQALYYGYKFKTQPDQLRMKTLLDRQKRRAVWHHELPNYEGSESDAVFERRMKGIWELFRDMHGISKTLIFDPESYLWPKHHYEASEPTSEPRPTPLDPRGPPDSRTLEGCNRTRPTTPEPPPELSSQHLISTTAETPDSKTSVEGTLADNLGQGCTDLHQPGTPSNQLILQLIRELNEVSSSDLESPPPLLLLPLDLTNPDPKLDQTMLELDAENARLDAEIAMEEDLIREEQEKEILAENTRLDAEIAMEEDLIREEQEKEILAENARLDEEITIEEDLKRRAKEDDERKEQEAIRRRALEMRAAQQKIELALAPNAERQRLEDLHWRERIKISFGVAEVVGSEDPFKVGAARVGFVVVSEPLISPKSVMISGISWEQSRG